MKNNHGGDIYSILREYKISPAELVDFSVNLNPLGTPPGLEKMILDNIGEVMHYPDPEYIDCRETIARYHRLTYRDITAGNGATELIFLYCRVTKPVKALIAAPAFSEYRRALEAVGADIRYFELKEQYNFKPDIDSLKREISNGYDLVVICNPNNPAGTLICREDMLDIAGHALLAGCRVMVDESFIEFSPDGSEQYSVVNREMPSNIFVIRSLTKIFALPGLRLGYGISMDGELNRKLSEQKEPWSVNVFAARSSYFLLSDPAYLHETRHVVSLENKFLEENLKNFTWLKVFSSPVNYMILKILNSMKSYELRDKLLHEKILIRDASNFEFLNDKFIRIAVKDRVSNQRLINALKEME